ncbi:hypothetical protein SAMN03159444_04411 [Pseudomonas sp. NFACC02]|nr:hypothetical protein SAMN03159444_04411 [Pseudomonas sp. NFACC02]
MLACFCTAVTSDFVCSNLKNSEQGSPKARDQTQRDLLKNETPVSRASTRLRTPTLC